MGSMSLMLKSTAKCFLLNSVSNDNGFLVLANLQFMEFGILSSFLSFFPFLLAAGEPAAMAEELPLMSSAVTEEGQFFFVILSLV